MKKNNDSKGKNGIKIAIGTLVLAFSIGGVMLASGTINADDKVVSNETEVTTIDEYTSTNDNNKNMGASDTINKDDKNMGVLKETNSTSINEDKETNVTSEQTTESTTESTTETTTESTTESTTEGAANSLEGVVYDLSDANRGDAKVGDIVKNVKGEEVVLEIGPNGVLGEGQ